MKEGDGIRTPDGATGTVMRIHAAGEYWEDEAAVVEFADGSRLTYTIEQLSSDSSGPPGPEAEDQDQEDE